ncbi:MAG: hypothetical protein N2558_04195 [Patescibacteria group bacterium]|nr:hypothetical protein [Patescibacteria group bacterium]
MTSSLLEKFKKVADTIRAYPHQFTQVWDQVFDLYLPHDYKQIDKVVFCGMGGSALGARVADSLLMDSLRVTLEIFNGYTIPTYTDEKTLVVLSSYSGNTEEVIECAYKALQTQAKIVGISAGGKLFDVLKEHQKPVVLLDTIHNPSEQPRFGIGYSVGSVLALLTKLGIATISPEDRQEALSTMFEMATEFHENNTFSHNLAYDYAKKLKGKIPVLVTAEHLVGSAYVIKNQLNESAKTFALLFEIPELNHHLMEGLVNPAKMKDLLTFVFFDSKNYQYRVSKRFPITAEVVEKNNIEHLTYKCRSKSKFSQGFEILFFGSMMVYFLAYEYNVDPMIIPWVDYFKEKLSK